MGSLRDRIKANLQPVVQGLLEPGEQVRASAQILVGPNPWLFGGVLMLLVSHFYFLVVTDRRVLFIKSGGGFTARPKGLAFADPLSPEAIVEYRPRRLWSMIRYRRPDGSLIRINLNRLWIPDRDQIVAALRHAPAAPGSTGPTTEPPIPPPPLG